MTSSDTFTATIISGVPFTAPAWAIPQLVAEHEGDYRVKHAPVFDNGYFPFQSYLSDDSSGMPNGISTGAAHPRVKFQLSARHEVLPDEQVSVIAIFDTEPDEPKDKVTVSYERPRFSIEKPPFGVSTEQWEAMKSLADGSIPDDAELLGELLRSDLAIVLVSTTDEERAEHGSMRIELTAKARTLLDAAVII
jgi:hypothetical protein